MGHTVLPKQLPLVNLAPRTFYVYLKHFKGKAGEVYYHYFTISVTMITTVFNKKSLKSFFQLSQDPVLSIVLNISITKVTSNLNRENTK